MKKQTIILAILLVLISGITKAQFYGGGGFYMQRGYGYPPPQRPYQPRPYQRYQQRRRADYYKPTLNLSFGYGFPNLDKNYFANEFGGSVNAYKGSTYSQTGPVTAALDFQFSKYSSIGIMGTYGKTGVGYYDYNSNSNVPLFNGNITSYSVLFNMVTYFPSYESVSPYIRTAVGVSSRNETYTYSDGSKAAIGGNNLNDLAYQLSIGARFNFSPNVGFFIEAGYGRYIVNGGLTFRF